MIDKKTERKERRHFCFGLPVNFSELLHAGPVPQRKTWAAALQYWMEIEGTKLVVVKHTHTHTRLMALFSGLPRWAGTRKVKRMWILLKQETVTGSGISWAICKSAPRSRQITTPAPHHSVFYRPYALPATQPTASKHWRQSLSITSKCIFCTVS